ncbi:hypothetical protein GOBAR_AA34987 [Gossypium barbadense]|uniref:Uncharacterized protein n=1 Tax=Gossypium barbadense TaxID=3634 RepID=A0A2P5W3R5_GOSBA|nr:hypothetical protein GOBAR_AA34987 [Gossypium barbadense]
MVGTRTTRDKIPLGLGRAKTEPTNSTYATSEPLPSKGLGIGVTGSFECRQGLGKAKALMGCRLGRHKASLTSPTSEALGCPCCPRHLHIQRPRLSMVSEAPTHPSTKVPMLLEAPVHPRHQGADSARGSHTTKGLGSRMTRGLGCRLCPRLSHDQGPRCRSSRGSRTTKDLGFRWWPRLPYDQRPRLLMVPEAPHDQGPRLSMVPEAPIHPSTKVPMVPEAPTGPRA